MSFDAKSFNVKSASDTVVRLRCPSCRHNGTFEKIVEHEVAVPHSLVLGQRRCPEPSCHAHIFFAYDQTKSRVTVSYPTELIDFDSSDIPERIRTSFNEAIICFANQCYVASAIMVRKTLEEICADREAKGVNLKERLKGLKKKVVLPNELLEGRDDLRLLGNDAAHIEANQYDNVGSDEVEISIDITKEILKSVYQYKGLIGKLQKLKKENNGA